MNENSQNVSKYLLYFIGIVAIFILGFYFGRVNISNKLSPSENYDYQLDGEIKESYNGVDLNILWEAWGSLEEIHYEENLDGEELLYGAVKGLVAGVGDKYTNFLDPEETEDYESSNKREFEGIGTTLAEEGQFVIIETPIDGAPAQSAGLVANDVILEVDQQEMQGMSVFEVAKNIRGEAGTDVQLTVFRPDTSEQLEFTIQRSKIDLDNISVSFDEETKIATIKIFQFTEENVSQFNQLWDEKVEEVLSHNPEGIIVDLRNNPGGYVDSVTYVVGEFLPKGEKIFSEEDKFGAQDTYKVQRTGKFTEIPLVVLVNEGSASASEIFSGAVQDNDRAEIVGMKTVGKGVEQKLVELSDGSLMQIVFKVWKTPSGRKISPEDPITPEHEIEEYEEQEEKAIELLKN